MTDAQTQILTVVITLVGGAIGGYVAMTRLHYRQQWWNRKAQAYDNIVGALGAINFTLWEWENRFLNIVDNLPDEHATALQKERREALSVIKKLASASDFLITAETGKALREAAGAMDASINASHPMEGIDADSKAIDKCIEVVKREARRDLKLSFW